MAKEDFWVQLMTHPVLESLDKAVEKSGYYIMSPRITVIIAPLIFLMIFLFIFSVFIEKKSKKNSYNAVLLMGPIGSGKTTLFHVLRYGKSPATVTSMKVNDSSFVLHSEAMEGESPRQVNVIDIPGHPRLAHIASDFFRIAGGIVFMIDSADVKAQLRFAAEALYNLMTDAIIVEKISEANSNKPSSSSSSSSSSFEVMIACNKCDLQSSKSKMLIKSALEKEIDAICKSRAAIPSDSEKHGKSNNKHTSSSDGSDFVLVSEGETFSFKNAPVEVSFVETEAKIRGKGMEEVEGFIRKVCPK